MPDHPTPAKPPSPSLLIAVTGGPGSSKTQLLAELAGHQLGRGQRVEGVLALAVGRRLPNGGADEYWLRLIGSGQELSWAVRDDSLDPPYYFEPETERKLHTWAARLASLPPSPLLILDEFSKFEARGKGLMPLWPVLAASAPQVVVIAVREGLVAEIEQVLGRKFDLCVPAAAPDALQRLGRACEDYGEWTRIGLFGGAAGGLEMTVGAVLHAAHIPFTGLVMSSLQTAMMVFAGAGLGQPGRVVWVPFISGGLKALSPAGNRVRPMLAIVMQGLIFGGTVQSLGWNVFALGLGGALVGAWAALQGFLLQYLLLGNDLMHAYETVVRWVAEHWHLSTPSLPWLLGAWAALHAVAAGGSALTAWKLKQPPVAVQEMLDKETITAPPMAARPGWRRLRDFGQWQFWLPFLLVATILLGSGRPWVAVLWLALRFLAVGCVLIAMLSLLRPARWAEQLRSRGWWGPALAFSGALRRRQPRE